MAEQTKRWESLKWLGSDELYAVVLAALKKHKGDREGAAAEFGISLRTLNRYIHDLNMYADLDKLGLVKRNGPPRKSDKEAETRKDKIVRHINENNGELDYGELAIAMYRKDDEKMRARVYQALTELKAAGVIALDGQRWFVL